MDGSVTRLFRMESDASCAKVVQAFDGSDVLSSIRSSGESSS